MPPLDEILEINLKTPESQKMYRVISSTQVPGWAAHGEEYLIIYGSAGSQ